MDATEKKVDEEYNKYRKKEFANYESDYDRAIEELTREVKRIERKE